MAFGLGVRRLPGGRLRVRIGAGERDVLRTLPGQLRPLLSGERDLDTAAGWVRHRMFPAAYADPLDELEYRELVGNAVSEGRMAAVEDFAKTLDGGTVRMGLWTAELTSEQADAWLSALNDARLTLAMVVGITTEADWEHHRNAADPTSAVLSYLGWLQEQLLHAVMGGLE